MYSYPDPDYYFTLIRQATSLDPMLSRKQLEQTFPVPRLFCSHKLGITRQRGMTTQHVILSLSNL